MTLLVKPTIAELFQEHPGVHHIFVYDHHGVHKGLYGKWALAQSLRRQGFDLAILFQNAFEAALLTFLSGIPKRLGYARDGRSFLLTDPFPLTKESAAGHQAHYYMDLLQSLGGSPIVDLTRRVTSAWGYIRRTAATAGSPHHHITKSKRS